MNRVLPDGAEGWTAAGVDEFLRSYLTRRGRAAFYAAARNIPLEAPHGPDGLWTRLASLEPPALFVWGRADRLVPFEFAGHVRRVLPLAEHLELPVRPRPQLERPGVTHEAMRTFLRDGGGGGERSQTAATSVTWVSRRWLPDGSRNAASTP